MCDYINAEARRKLIKWAAVCPDPDVRADARRLEEAMSGRPVRAPQGPRKPVGPDDQPGSHAVPPLDFNVVHRPNAPAMIGAAGDPDRAWRVQDRALAAIWQDDAPVRLGSLNADDALDLYLAVSEFAAVYNRDRRVAAYAERMIAAGDAVLRGEKDAEGRAVPIGRLLGVQPSAGATATQSIADGRRNRLLREARATVPEWASLPHRRAAAAMILDFGRYRTGRWQADQTRLDAPGGNPATAFWWRLLRLDHGKPMPAIDRLADILAE